MSDLSAFSEALAENARGREEQRQAFSDELEKRVLWFQPDADEEQAAKGFGIGWVYSEGEFLGFYRWANGYALHPTLTLAADFLKKLVSLIPEDK